MSFFFFLSSCKNKSILLEKYFSLLLIFNSTCFYYLNQFICSFVHSSTTKSPLLITLLECISIEDSNILKLISSINKFISLT
ncbi:hypothetical protein CL6EHI_c00078 [Entamoeba histolytica]|uniref:Uncharacterized protein n=1 Tax=Entamoeba histolytica TaxID=5759 RepID=A0A175JL07_ENTHI|nr:hypothetical protein CL6EHI_c00078 [Entamoeba histolytica]